MAFGEVERAELVKAVVGIVIKIELPSRRRELPDIGEELRVFFPRRRRESLPESTSSMPMLLAPPTATMRAMRLSSEHGWGRKHDRIRSGEEDPALPSLG